MDRGRALTGSKDGKGHEGSRFQRLMHRPVRRADAQGPARAKTGVRFCKNVLYYPFAWMGGTVLPEKSYLNPPRAVKFIINIPHIPSIVR